MQRKIYYLSSCSTCTRIIKELNINHASFVMQDIKNEAITNEQLEEMKARSGSFESLFSRRAMKYKSMGLKEKLLAEQDYKKLILQEYTFLKRPVIIINDQIFIGSEKSTIQKLKETLSR